MLSFSLLLRLEEGDVQELLQHETRRESLSLSREGETRSGNKVDLLPCLKDEIKFSTTDPTSQSSNLEGSVLVNILKPNNSKMFTDYSDDVFSAAIKK